MDAPHGHAAKILQLAAQLKELADKIERETAAVIVEGAERPTRSMVSGLPCTADVVWDQEPPVGLVEPVDSSQMIPEAQIERSARGGE